MSEERKPILDQTDDSEIKKSNLSQLDRIKGHYLDKIDLDQEDEKYRLLLAKVNHWFEEGENISGCRDKLVKEDKFKQSHATQVVSDALELYGDIGKSNKEGLRNLLTNHFIRLAKKSEDDKNYFTAGQLLERAARINQLHDTGDQEQKGGRRIQISYSRNPEVLKKKEA